MSILKFRAWDSCNKKYMYLEGCSLWFPYGIEGQAHIPGWIEKELPLLSGNPGTRQFRAEVGENKQWILEQFTGIKDKDGLTEIYEGDIIDDSGIVKGNVHESSKVYRDGIDCIVTGMGTATWRSTESVAMGRGCHYPE
jgi:hypothetical protein